MTREPKSQSDLAAPVKPPWTCANCDCDLNEYHFPYADELNYVCPECGLKVNAPPPAPPTLAALVEELRKAGQSPCKLGCNGWYSGDGVAHGCDCGANTHNAAVDAAARRIIEALRDTPVDSQAPA